MGGEKGGGGRQSQSSRVRQREGWEVAGWGWGERREEWGGGAVPERQSKTEREGCGMGVRREVSGGGGAAAVPER